MTERAAPLHPVCRYWLARAVPKTPGVAVENMRVELVDGCHDSPAGVVEAARLHLRLFGSRGPWVMLELHELPDLEVEINEEAAAAVSLRDKYPPFAGQGASASPAITTDAEQRTGEASPGQGMSGLGAERNPDGPAPRRTYICPVHGRWVKIVRPDGDTMRPCPECSPFVMRTPVLSKRSPTGLV